MTVACFRMQDDDGSARVMPPPPKKADALAFGAAGDYWATASPSRRRSASPVRKATVKADPAPREKSAVGSRSIADQRSLAFAMLTFASVSMTLGNKWLMAHSELRQHTEIVVMVQNSIAVCVTGSLILAGAVQMKRVTRRQAFYFTWDAFVLAIQTYTSFQALRHLPVSATTVCRVLGVPCVALLERLILGARLDGPRLACAGLVVAGALLYARDDLRDAGAGASVGYGWAAANLAAFVSNSLIDKHFMASSDQTASGMAMLTQAISLPFSLAHLLALRPAATPLATATALLRGLDARGAAVLAATSALAALLGQCYATCYMLASATAVTIAGNANRALAIALSCALFGARMSGAQLAGLLLCLGGALAFSLLSQRARTPARTAGDGKREK